ncbi:hypothetical protein HYC85_012178 [Camellia sinensis]|uniref:Uncharacterized protein n=1 Tax=Camellia sinensis TaxID=4442 RepID=A0A7J7HC59_CAMSI|nr:hypothetical protein HYC85_012178 [Camellia sinensis]
MLILLSERGFETPDMPCGCCEHSRDSSDLVALKISLLDDSQIGKTSFLARTTYVGGERQEEGFEISNSGLNQMDKTLCVGGARIAYRIWEVVGDETSQNQIPSACKDSVAMSFMFDLTSRCTSNRKWNQVPMLCFTTSCDLFRRQFQYSWVILIITISCSKFDDFVQLPIDVQWTIASQARAYASALNATLFFPSATYNIISSRQNCSTYYGLLSETSQSENPSSISSCCLGLNLFGLVVSIEYNEENDTGSGAHISMRSARAGLLALKQRLHTPSILVLCKTSAGRGRGSRRGRQEMPLSDDVPAIQEGVGQANVAEPAGQQAMCASA